MKYAKLSEYKIKKILTLFCIDIVASKAAYILKLNRKTVDHYYHHFRMMLTVNSEESGEYLSGQVEIAILYKCNNCNYVIVGMADKHAKVVIVQIPKNKLIDIALIKKHIADGSTLFIAKDTCEENFSHYGYKHCEMGDRESEVLYDKKCTLNTVHSFSSYCKRRLNQFNGPSNLDCYMHFKECEFRFNRTFSQLNSIMLTILKLDSKYSALTIKSKSSGPTL